MPGSWSRQSGLPRPFCPPTAKPGVADAAAPGRTPKPTGELRKLARLTFSVGSPAIRLGPGRPRSHRRRCGSAARAGTALFPEGRGRQLSLDMTERRFNEAEIAAIFERAAVAQQTRQHQLPSLEGMTLTELQEIGREVGISSELVAQAAKAIELGGRPTSRRFLGLPVGVGRTVDLDRTLSDDEWERFVVDLRETFDARGTVRREGSLRQ